MTVGAAASSAQANASAGSKYIELKFTKEELAEFKKPKPDEFKFTKEELAEFKKPKPDEFKFTKEELKAYRTPEPGTPKIAPETLAKLVYGDSNPIAAAVSQLKKMGVIAKQSK